MRMLRQLWILPFWFGLLLLPTLLLPPLALAQGSPVIVDEPGMLSESAVEQAAAPLERRGARVAIYLLDSAGAAECDSRLQADGLRNTSGQVRNELIAICVGLPPNPYSSIIHGDEWSDALMRQVNGEPNWEIIRREVLNPQLSAGDFTQGYVDTLLAIESAIQNPPAETPISTAPIGWAIGGAAALGVGAAVGVPAMRRRRRAQLALKAAKERYETSRNGAGSAIADFGQYMKTAEEKAKFDKVSYPAAEVAQLEGLMRQGREGLRAAQERFDDVEEALQGKREIRKEEYEQAAAGYDSVTETATTARASVAEAEKIRAELDALRRQADDNLGTLKKG